MHAWGPWVEDIFNSDLAKAGGPLIRKTRWVIRQASEQQLLAAARHYGFQVLLANEHYLLISKDVFTGVLLD